MERVDELNKESIKRPAKTNMMVIANSLSAYLIMMYERLKLMHNLLAKDGSIYVHCDWRMTSYLRLLLNDIFGSSIENFRNEIIWCYQGPGSPGMKQFNRKHDSILWYTKSDKWIFNDNDIRIAHSEKTKENC